MLIRLSTDAPPRTYMHVFIYLPVLAVFPPTAYPPFAHHIIIKHDSCAEKKIRKMAFFKNYSTEMVMFCLHVLLMILFLPFFFVCSFFFDVFYEIYLIAFG